MKRVAAYLITALLIASIFPADIYADSSASGQNQIAVFLKPDISVKYYGEKKLFKDANGRYACPIVYQGRTYLPLRGISGLMKEPIAWDKSSKTVFIGKSMANPDKTTAKVYTDAVETVDETYNNIISNSATEMETAYLNQDVIVMYDFVIKTYQSEKGETVTPILYKNSTYLPIRAIAAMMNEPILWLEESKTISIGRFSHADGDETAGPDKQSRIVRDLNDIFDRTEALFYEATSKITKISTAKTLKEKQVIAESISKDYEEVSHIAGEVSDWTKFNSSEEVSAYQEVKAFVTKTEYYLLLLENVAYLAASDEDYSILSKLFFDQALDAQNAMNNARSLLSEF
ncbi:hypothetical protein FRZ06_17880 [Anoxybacterium hadale]|uniref:Uncharacterized protein n=1 Tax=Anoxybacterium hadale TaxID=3408580 RepID=A0ACD1AF62_9FIRM|nr:hypothetical protein FRZ06_17880 [Clostridiales bacterium]